MSDPRSTNENGAREGRRSRGAGDEPASDRAVQRTGSLDAVPEAGCCEGTFIVPVGFGTDGTFIVPLVGREGSDTGGAGVRSGMVVEFCPGFMTGGLALAGRAMAAARTAAVAAMANLVNMEVSPL